MGKEKKKWERRKDGFWGPTSAWKAWLLVHILISSSKPKSSCSVPNCSSAVALQHTFCWKLVKNEQTNKRLIKIVKGIEVQVWGGGGVGTSRQQSGFEEVNFTQWIRSVDPASLWGLSALTTHPGFIHLWERKHLKDSHTVERFQ